MQNLKKTWYLFPLLLCAVLLLPKPGQAQGENYSVQFNGDDHVTMGTMNLSGSALTIEAWVYPDRFPNTLHTIAGIERSGDATALLRVGDAGRSPREPQFVLRIGEGQVKLNADQNLTTKEWQHVAGTYDGTHMRLYIDGELVSVREQAGEIDADGVFRISKSFGGRYFHGKIDEVRVWNTARNHGQITGGMDAHLRGQWPGLVGYWTFNDPQGSTVEDESGNGYDGTIQGAIWAGPSAPITGSMTSPASRDATGQGFAIRLPNVALRGDAEESRASLWFGDVLLSGTSNWEMETIREFQFQIRKPQWDDFYWKVNTSTGDVDRVEGGTFGSYDGRDERLGLSVTSEGGLPNDPKSFHVTLPTVTIRYTPEEIAPDLTYRRPSSGRAISLVPESEWEVTQIQDDLYHIRPKEWDARVDNLYWTVDVSQQTVYQVKNGTYGRRGDTGTQLDVDVNRIRY